MDKLKLQSNFERKLPSVNIITKKLKNGLILNHIKSDFPGIFRVELIVRVGTLCEKPNEIGFAHFIEHLMSFFPSKKYPDSIYNQRKLNSKGIEINAWTDPNTVGYYMYGNEKYKDYMIDMIMENYKSPVLDSKVFEQERNAVIAELSNIINSGEYELEQLSDYIMYTDTNLAFTIEQELDNVKKNATLDNIMSFRDRYYEPEYISIIISSDMSDSNANKFLTFIEKKWFQKQPETQKTPKNYKKSSFGRKITYIPPQITNNIVIYNTLEPNQQEEVQEKLKCPEVLPKSGIIHIPTHIEDDISLLFRFPINIDYFDDDKVYIDALSSILSRGLSSRLYYALRTTLGAVYNVSASAYYDEVNKRFSHFDITTVTKKGKVKNVFDYIIIELEKLINNESEYITNDELSNYCDNVELENIKLTNMRSPSKMLDIYKPNILWGKPIKPLEEYIRSKKNLSIGKMKRVAKMIFCPDNLFIFYCCNESILLTENNNNIHYTMNLSCIKQKL